MPGFDGTGPLSSGMGRTCGGGKGGGGGRGRGVGGGGGSGAGRGLGGGSGAGRGLGGGSGAGGGRGGGSGRGSGANAPQQPAQEEDIAALREQLAWHEREMARIKALLDAAE